MAVENYSITSPSLNDGSQNDGSTVPAQKSALWKRPLFAAVCSGFIPGLGQWLLGAKRKGVLFFLAYCAMVTGYFLLRLPRWYLPWCVLVIAVLALCIIASASVLWNSSGDGPSSKWLFHPSATCFAHLHRSQQWLAYSIGVSHLWNPINFNGKHYLSRRPHRC
jgi:hypothetical protein